MLDERKMAILTEIVDYYINSAEPIGSRTLSKLPSIGLSSATIRNEMSDLEELGYLTKTHISSGRIPSDKAYRLYVNKLMEKELKRNDKFIKSLKNTLLEDVLSLNDYYETANKLLSQRTNYITVILSPKSTSSVIEFIRLELLSENRLLIILVGRQGENSSYIFNNFRIENDVSVLDLENHLKRLIINKNKEDLKKDLESFNDEIPNSKLFKGIYKLVINFLDKQDSYNVYLSGLANILSFDNGEIDVRSLIGFLEDENNLIDVGTSNELDSLLNIKIGNENKSDILRTSSIITTKYKTGLGNFGNISLIGPTRMDYKRLANILYNFSVILGGNK